MGREPLTTSIRNAARKKILETIPAMAKAAEEGNPIAFEKLMKAGGIIDGGGIKINNQIGVGVDARNHGDTESDWKFFQRFQRVSQGKLTTQLLREALPPPDEGADAPETANKAKENMAGVQPKETGQ